MTSIQVLACEWPVVSCRDPPARLKSIGEAKGTAPPNQTSEMSPLALGAERGGSSPSFSNTTYIPDILSENRKFRQRSALFPGKGLPEVRWKLHSMQPEGIADPGGPGAQGKPVTSQNRSVLSACHSRSPSSTMAVGLLLESLGPGAGGGSLAGI